MAGAVEPLISSPGVYRTRAGYVVEIHEIVEGQDWPPAHGTLYKPGKKGRFHRHFGSWKPNGYWRHSEGGHAWDIVERYNVYPPK